MSLKFIYIFPASELWESIMDHVQSHQSIPRLLDEISWTLFGMRDALLRLALLLQDLRLEMDQQEGARAQAEFLALLERLRQSRGFDQSDGSR